MHTFQNSRHFDHAPQAIFAAIQDPERLARWWGPNGFSNHFEVFEFRSGGRWVFDMVGPDGARYANVSEFFHIEENRQVAIDHTCAPHFRLTITLTPEDGGTRVHWVQVFEDAAFAQTMQHILEPANEQNLDRLGAELNSGRRR
ncbi:MAG: SRPBCC domain-containing protein [Pseudomonadota bacterium]